MQPMLEKGIRVLVEGYLRQDKWKKDGKSRTAISIGAERIRVLGSPASSLRHDKIASVSESAMETSTDFDMEETQELYDSQSESDEEYFAKDEEEVGY